MSTLSNRNPRIEQGIRMYQAMRQTEAANETIPQTICASPPQYKLSCWVREILISFLDWVMISSTPRPVTTSKPRRPPVRQPAKIERKQPPVNKVHELQPGDLTNAYFTLLNFLPTYFKNTRVKPKAQEGWAITFGGTSGHEGNIFRFNYRFLDQTKTQVFDAEFDVIPGRKNTPPEIRVVKDHRTEKRTTYWRVLKT